MVVAAKGSLFSPELKFLKKPQVTSTTTFGDIDHLLAASLVQEQKYADHDQQLAVTLQVQEDAKSAALISHESDAAERKERASAVSASNQFLSQFTMPSACSKPPMEAGGRRAVLGGVGGAEGAGE
jgi:hypothetical protein